MVQPPSPTENKEIAQLRDRLSSRLDKTRLTALQGLLDQGEAGQTVLQDALLAARDGEQLSWLAGSIYRSLSQNPDPATAAFLQTHFPSGLVPFRSAQGIDYGQLETLLVTEQYQKADAETSAKLCQLAGESAAKRKWIYFSEAAQLPIEDLQTLDQLWTVYSDGLFGFSVQREIWLSVGRVWENLWPRIGWKDGNKWTRYPGSFTWNRTAPRGHLPLSNQLRGVRVMDSLLNHPAFNPDAAPPA
ncbi:MAG: GUN4 domain-containing protein [Synechococcales cyanobacterium RM1_1_8]|nr:GUN4 domain-containing protein [Synechococcales cyanobacterium RM1_1_8]